MSGTGEARQSTADFRARLLRRRQAGRVLAARAAKLDRFDALIGDGIDPGERLHILSRGHFDTVTIPAWFAARYGGIRRLTASSLTISRPSVVVLQQLHADGLLDEARIVIQDLTMSRSEHRAHIEAVRNFMQSGTHTLRVVESHAKVIVIEPHAGPVVVVETSANLSSNDNRVEQYAIYADAELAAFHLEWLDEIFAHDEEKLRRSWRPSPASPRVVAEGRDR